MRLHADSVHKDICTATYGQLEERSATSSHVVHVDDLDAVVRGEVQTLRHEIDADHSTAQRSSAIRAVS